MNWAIFVGMVIFENIIIFPSDPITWYLRLIENFPRHEPDRFLENSSMLLSLNGPRKFYGYLFNLFEIDSWPRPISGIFIQSPILDFRSIAETDFWKTHPKKTILGPEKLKFRKNFEMSFPGFANNGQDISHQIHSNHELKGIFRKILF